MIYLLQLIDNDNNDNEEHIIRLKANNRAAAIKEACKEVLDIRFGEDR